MKRLIVTGGGAKSHAYKQILADLAQQEITQLDVEESAARGACIQAASATGQITVDEILKIWALDVVDLIKPRYQAGLTEYFSDFDICSGWRGLDRKSKF
jgi:xylulokinase